VANKKISTFLMDVTEDVDPTSLIGTHMVIDYGKRQLNAFCARIEPVCAGKVRVTAEFIERPN
jgi:hypothetical protein